MTFQNQSSEKHLANFKEGHQLLLRLNEKGKTAGSFTYVGNQVFLP